MKRLTALALFCSAATPLLAQNSSSDAAGAAIAAGAGVVNCVISLISTAAWIVAAIWVMKDAKRRNSPNATLVTVLTWIPCTWFIGLIVHLVTRPKDPAGTGTIPPPPTV